MRAGRTSSTARAFAGDPPSDFRAAEGFLERKADGGCIGPWTRLGNNQCVHASVRLVEPWARPFTELGESCRARLTGCFVACLGASQHGLSVGAGYKAQASIFYRQYLRGK